MADIFFTERGRERLDNLDRETQDRIKKKLGEIEDWPDHFLKPLKGRNDYALRIGDYRALIEWEKNDDENDVLYVKSVGHRRNFYDQEM
ncbi:type II toxin-antitoxin system RelE/ParE family toxin [Halorubrum terrestre]|uniref:Type II toxin-antitoxin system RelE/ParE family toxin n=1 Tax=Halorubrum distributum TaxID=29283 RepID=A0A6B1IFS4_9EURY|nr:type II toxin-antitoxin system RelE/ParE family toxin [Halorubrum terrestre]MYL17478.1 type II toxin-antitoxin system RelE/ParE family toxin [Halorubrum terrestre]